MAGNEFAAAFGGSNRMPSLWSGHITFGLISIPVSLHSALEASERAGFHLFHRKDMAPIRYTSLQQGGCRGERRRDREGPRGREEGPRHC